MLSITSYRIKRRDRREFLQVIPTVDILGSPHDQIAAIQLDSGLGDLERPSTEAIHE